MKATNKFNPSLLHSLLRRIFYCINFFLLFSYHEYSCRCKQSFEISKKRINEIERLKEEVKSNEDKLFDGEKISKLLTDLKYEKHSSLNDIAVLESTLIKLEISPEWIDRIIMIESFYHFESKLNLKQYFNNKSLLLYVNQVLLDFLFMSVSCNQ